ncbi:hypothetical protein GCM10010123_45240 [Pilimelia anulata]|uniref:Uncharacterized protein n=1 Tax=Pilimelia anulata TaxID=53371 RepID=A0A8J3FEV4_9ACTN|nr:hypothetical protein [Pilimelia anulata]GGK10236.1 hypothetical protein GCM10010123_45240 [Pilimelia anulata]
MTDFSENRSPGSGADGTGSDATGAVADRVRPVVETAAGAGAQVAESVREQGGEVAAEAGRQARNLAHEAGGQLAEQARAQQQRAAGGLRTLGEELDGMAQASPRESGTATELARQASAKLTELAGWLEEREPGAVLDEVRRYARRKPGTFLLGAAALGVLAGRVTRNLGDPADGSARPAAGRAPATPPAPPVTPAPPVPAESPAAAPYVPAQPTATGVAPVPAGSAGVPPVPPPSGPGPGSAPGPGEYAVGRVEGSVR